jgi:hypoxanthine phosphoribosyltransferase
MTNITVKDKEFRISITASEIDAAIRKIADQINLDYAGKNPLFLAVLNGSFMFAADLLRKITIPCQITFIKLSSYAGTSTTTTVKELIGVNEEIASRNVIVLEDIIDTGITLEKLRAELEKHNPASIRLACFCHKPDAFIKDYKIDYIGMNIPNAFIVGYGLDYDGYGRNLADIYSLVKDGER